jgi:hypothetical protein
VIDLFVLFSQLELFDQDFNSLNKLKQFYMLSDNIHIFKYNNRGFFNYTNDFVEYYIEI